MSFKKNFICAVLIIFVSGCVFSKAVRDDSLPMYGHPEDERAAFLNKADEDFIKQAVSLSGSREEASQKWWEQGETYMVEGKLGDAMRQYNLSWMLNPDNYQPYWGFARILVERGELDGAIVHLEKSKSLIDDPYQQVALLSDMGAVYTYKALELAGTNEESKLEYFEKANNYFNESVKLEPDYPESWRNWSYSLFEQEKYAEAWEKIKKVRELGGRPYQKEFLEEMRSKMPEPE